MKGSGAGLFSTIKGVAQGKAIEAATGIQSVYVTNQLDETKIAMASAVTSGLSLAIAGVTMYQQYKDNNDNKIAEQLKKYEKESKLIELDMMKAASYGSELNLEAFNPDYRQKTSKIKDNESFSALMALPPEVRKVLDDANAVPFETISSFAKEIAAYNGNFAKFWKQPDSIRDYQEIYHILDSKKETQILCF